MSKNRKPLRARRGAPTVYPGEVDPTAHQIEEAMLAFSSAKFRYVLMQIHDTDFMVRVSPPMVLSMIVETEMIQYQDHHFTNEPAARQWREREIIREAITAGMRAKP